MRALVRATLLAGILVVPAVAATSAQADDSTGGSFSVPIGNSGNCVYGKTPTVQYNNGDPTMQAGEVYVNNCAS